MIPVVLIWREKIPEADGGGFETLQRHAILPAIPPIGALLIPPHEKESRNVRAQEWDCSRNDTSKVVIKILLDD